MLEFLLALLTTATVAALLVPLLRPRIAATDRLDNDTAVYRDQLAEVAHIMRGAVRERLTAGDSDEQVMQFMVARYGDYVLLKPPFKPATLILWLGAPLILLLAGGGLLLAARKRRTIETPPAPLTDDERARLDSLLGARHSSGAHDRS